MKINLILFIGFLFLSLSITPAHARDLELVIKDFKCMEEGTSISYGVINKKSFDRHNISICFKILVDSKPIECMEIKTTIPRNADGSNIKKAFIAMNCKKKPSELQNTILYSTKRYTIEEWFSGCKNFQTKTADEKNNL